MTDLASVDAGMEELVRNIEKLRSGLKVWQTWDAEYEELKEELQSMSDEANVNELVSAGDVEQRIFTNCPDCSKRIL